MNYERVNKESRGREAGRGFEICKRRESQGHVKVALHEITVTSRLGRFGPVVVVAGQKGALPTRACCAASCRVSKCNGIKIKDTVVYRRAYIQGTQTMRHH